MPDEKLFATSVNYFKRSLVNVSIYEIYRFPSGETENFQLTIFFHRCK